MYRINKEKQLQSFIRLYIKNEVSIKSKETLENIVIGQIAMPIGVLINAKDSKSDSCFDGKVRVCLRQNTSIGYLNVKVKYTELTDKLSFAKDSTTKRVFKIKEEDEDVTIFN